MLIKTTLEYSSGCENVRTSMYMYYTLVFTFYFTQLRSKASEPVHIVPSVPVRPMLSVWGMNAGVKKNSMSTRTTGLENKFVIECKNEVINIQTEITIR